MIDRALYSHSEIKVQCFPVLRTQDLGTPKVPAHKGQLLCTYCVDIPIQMILWHILSSTETIDIWTISLLLIIMLDLCEIYPEF